MVYVNGGGAGAHAYSGCFDLVGRGLPPPRKSSGSLWWVKTHPTFYRAAGMFYVLDLSLREFFTHPPQPSPASQGRANYKPTPAVAARVEGLFADDVHAGRRGEFELFGRDAAVALHVAEGEDGLGTAAVYHHRGDGVAVQNDPERVVFFLVGFGF